MSNYNVIQDTWTNCFQTIIVNIFRQVFSVLENLNNGQKWVYLHRFLFFSAFLQTVEIFVIS